jgi:NitT/TauT family transport system substrate-binding protein
MSRITDSGVGYVASFYSTFLPDGNPTIVYAATRAWAKANAAAARGFREAIVEAAAFVKDPKNDAAVRAAIGKFIKLPPEVLAKAQISPPGPIVTEKQLAYWVGLMKDQEMLRGNLDLSTLIVK